MNRPRHMRITSFNKYCKLFKEEAERRTNEELLNVSVLELQQYYEQGCNTNTEWIRLQTYLEELNKRMINIGFISKPIDFYDTVSYSI